MRTQRTDIRKGENIPAVVQLSGGTNIGNLTDLGGLAAAFDGTTAQASTSCAARSGSTTGYTNTVGKIWLRRTVVDIFTLYGPNNGAVLFNAGTGTTYKLQGSDDGSTWEDITGAITIASAAGSYTTTATLSRTSYMQHRVAIVGDGTSTLCVAEVIFYGRVV